MKNRDKIEWKKAKNGVCFKNRWKNDLLGRFLAKNSIFNRFLGPGRIPKVTPGRAFDASIFSSTFRFVPERASRRPDWTLGGPKEPQGPPKAPPRDHFLTILDRFLGSILGCSFSLHLSFFVYIFVGFSFGHLTLIGATEEHLMNIWIYEYMNIWIYEYMNIWIYEY